ncbi:hypothetical protein CDL12_24732 [Handroanthus impetiginosus]|uniref:Uncharacterized protein n=1 Tax=Handroanthus impetiginosus TaxID=429701 RepID=A0A2G9GBT4_9LAMI|nr:hypothetical protein CDL12_24732 [Handroanthus impetiginosus]
MWRGCIVQLVIVESSRANLVSLLREPVQERVVCLDLGYKVLSELLEYHLLTLVCHTSILILLRPLDILQVQLPEDPFLEVASAPQSEISRALAALRDCIWRGSGIVPSVVVMLQTMPILYEKFDDKIDALAQKAMIEIKKSYAYFV